MTRTLSIFSALAVALPAAGCLEVGGRSAPDARAVFAAASVPDRNTSAATWQMPWQISPSGAASAARGEEVILAWVPETGYVRGTRTALASLGQPLPAARGPNLTVEPCRDVVKAEAEKIGARAVEAASAGPHRNTRDGRRFAPVQMRVTYAILGGYEVRETTMTCIIDRNGKIVDAYS